VHQQQYRVGAASKLLRAKQHSHKVAEPVRLSVKHKLDRCCRFQLRKGSLQIHPAQAADACTPVNGSCHMAARHDKAHTHVRAAVAAAAPPNPAAATVK
jgi:hypothetical protein